MIDDGPGVRGAVVDIDDLLARMTVLFAAMDAAYQKTAGAYGFSCAGCTENCCSSIFHHHTLVEYALIREGLRALPRDEIDRIRNRAEQVRSEQAAGRSAPCPLLRENACILYGSRPMICRFHGLPHEHRHPLKGAIRGPGCHMFADRYRAAAGPLLDRTPFYRDVAGLEKEMRRRMKIATVPKRTVAEIILDLGD